MNVSPHCENVRRGGDLEELVVYRSRVIQAASTSSNFFCFVPCWTFVFAGSASLTAAGR